ncbi:MAG: MiaB/RimO family radical SAM methylthiotransferase [Algisphaera sp.]
MDATTAPQIETPDTGPGSGPLVYLETFGCQMNVLDSQLVTGQLRGLGYRFTDDWMSADVVLYNTCSVREVAENKVWSRVGKVGRHKRERPEVILGVIGCMAERDGEDLMRRHPQVDLMCGPGELDKLPMLIDNQLKTQLCDRGGDTGPRMALQGGSSRRSGTLAAAEDQLELVDLSRAFAGDDTRAAGRSAYVRVTRGCNKLCTYCVVPHTRGAEVHRPPSHIFEECRKLVEAGVIEITLLGQTVNHYHYDTAAAVEANGVLQPQVGTVIHPNVGTGGESPVFNDTTVSFANLLRKIHDGLPGLQRLRFITSFPRDFGNDILEAIRDCPRICRYLHLPVQSGSDRVLAKMNRGYRVADYRDLILRVRDILPDAMLATDIICGFPGETEEDHQKTAELLEWCRFKNSFIFKYSPRPGTVAFDRLADDIPNDVKKRRNNELIDLQNRISREVHGTQVGKTFEVFVEGVSRRTAKSVDGAAPGSAAVSLGWEQPREMTQLSGRTSGDLITVFDGTEDLIGQVVTVQVTGAGGLVLSGVQVGG